MRNLYYLDYKLARSGKSTVAWINQIIDDYTAHHCTSIDEVDEELCDMLVADHPRMNSDEIRDVVNFAEAHTETPVIITGVLGFAPTIQPDPHYPNIYYIEKSKLIRRETYTMFEERFFSN